MKKHRVLVLVREELVPPDSIEGIDVTKVDWKTEYDVVTTLRELGHDVLCVGVYDDLGVLRRALGDFQPHIVFMLLEEFHGSFTFDSNVVGYLELMKVPYTGCNSRGLMLARDKALSKKILRYHRIGNPRFFVCKKGHRPRRPRSLDYPLIVKSLTADASEGISQASVVRSDEKLAERVTFIHENVQTDAIVEQYIPGRELYVGVLGNARLTAFPVWELSFDKVPESFVRIATSTVKWNEDYREKHGIDSAEAAGLSPELQQKIQDVSKRIYRRLDMNGYARLDFRLTDDERLFLIEANPNPGIAYGEEFPDAAERANLSYSQLISRIVNLGLSWHRRRR